MVIDIAGACMNSCREVCKINRQSYVAKRKLMLFNNFIVTIFNMNCYMLLVEYAYSYCARRLICHKCQHKYNKHIIKFTVCKDESVLPTEEKHLNKMIDILL